MALKQVSKTSPPERLCGIFNSTVDDDQMKSLGEYIELSMQSQYNERDLQTYISHDAYQSTIISVNVNIDR